MSHLHALDTGEVPADSPSYADLLILLDQKEKHIAQLQMAKGRLEKQLHDKRAAEIESSAIKDVLEYWRDCCSPRSKIVAGGKRWERVRARLRERDTNGEKRTAEQLKNCVDAALEDDWLNGTDPASPGYLKVETIYRDPEQVERLLVQYEELDERRFKQRVFDALPAGMQDALRREAQAVEFYSELTPYMVGDGNAGR